jgi:hypothetical protein
VDLPGLDANGGPLYIGTGCFHRREALCGRRYSNENKVEWKEVNDRKVKESAGVLEEVSRILASCTSLSLKHKHALTKNTLACTN